MTSGGLYAGTPMEQLDVRELDGAVSVRILVKPRSSKSCIVGVRAGALEVAVASPPVDGAANDELIRTLGRELGVRRSDIHLLSGATGRTKLVRIDGMTTQALLRKVPGATPGA
jgi:uncharacterized protein